MGTLSGAPDRKHIFVVGLHRSGTSILSELLKAHPFISGHKIDEMPKELENEGQHVQVIAPRLPEPTRTRHTDCTVPPDAACFPSGRRSRRSRLLCAQPNGAPHGEERAGHERKRCAA